MTTSKVSSLSQLDTGGSDLAAAADIIARGAKDNARWSRKIPPTIAVSVDGNTATIGTSLPFGRAVELRLKHPLFGDRRHWYGPTGEKFLEPALDSHIDEAVARYAEKFDKHARQLGFH